jgi:dihydropyrimidinase
MRGGSIQCVATDECCCPLEVKLKGSRIDDTFGGNSGVEPRVPLIYTQMMERGFTLEEFVAQVSGNAAKIMGLYPRKGALAVGSDADIVLLDPKRAGPIRKENLHETDYTPWEDWDAAVWPSITIQRGKVMVENGKLLASLTDGKFLSRKIDDTIRSRPAL